MVRALLFGIFFVGFAVTVNASPSRIHEQLCQLVGKYEYNILIEGESAGKQIIHIQRKGPDQVIMETEIEMNIGYLLFFNYSHKHKTREVWRAGKLEEIEGETDDNGKSFQLKLKWNGKQMIGTGPEGKMSVAQPLATNNAWNLGLIFSEYTKLSVMNPETGVVTQFQVKKLSDSSIAVGGKKINCKQIQFVDRSWKFWFSPSGVLVKQEDLLAGYKVEIILNKISTL